MRNIEPTSAAKAAAVGYANAKDVAMATAMSARISFDALSEDVMFKCFQHLEGGREALRLTAVSKAWKEQLDPCNDTMWKTFGSQEFGDTNLQAPPAPTSTTGRAIGFTGVDRYASLARAASLKQALWGRVQTRGFGAREGTPWLFLGRTGEEIFAFGGYGSRGPANDLATAPLTALKALLSVTSAGIVVDSSFASLPSSIDAMPQDDAERGKLEPAAMHSDRDPQQQPNSVAPRLDFTSMHTRGSPPRPSYGATLTPLVDDELPGCEWLELDAVRHSLSDPSFLMSLPQGTSATQSTLFLVTGGYLYGGYRGESADWSLGIVPPPLPTVAPDVSDSSTGGTENITGHSPASAASTDQATQGGALGDQTAEARRVYWVKPGPAFLDDLSRNEPTARSNATAVFVPARFADSSLYPRGYIMLFGGNVARQASNTIDILDLSNFVWTQMGTLPNAPRARNSHSAILMPDAEEPGSKAKILVFGGANGADVPRAGQDFNDFAVFDPREMEWSGEASSSAVPGRAHVAVKIGRSVLFFGGGLNPTDQLSAVDCQRLSDSGLRGAPETNNFRMMREVLSTLPWKILPPCGDARPTPRAFHAAISLAPAGVPVLLTYGGWHPQRGNFGDVWAAKLDAWDASKQGGGVGHRAQKADLRFQQTLSSSPQEDAYDSDEPDMSDEEDGPYVNVGGRVMPLATFALYLRNQMGEEEGLQALMALMQQSAAERSEGQDQQDPAEGHDE